jgi:hypothetical protein
MPEYKVETVKPGTAIVWPTKIKPTVKQSDATRKMQSLMLKKLAPTSAEQWQKILGTLPGELGLKAKKSKFWERGDEYVLSARTPIIEGHGSLNGNQIQSYVPSHPALWFDYQSGYLEIWLESLDTSGTYMVELRLAVHGGPVLIGASDAPNAELPAQGADHRAQIYITDLTSDISLITLRGDKTEFFGFYDATLWLVT